MLAVVPVGMKEMEMEGKEDPVYNEPNDYYMIRKYIDN
jgi:hypothetical protein